MVVSSPATQGPTVGLQLRGPPTLTHLHALPWQLPPPLVAIGPLVTPAYIRSHDSRCEVMMQAPAGNPPPSP